VTSCKALIDLRSDTVTQPCAGMRKAMHDAILGDDVYGEDPTVRELEETLAEMAGKDSGLFLPSGTQSNLCALMAHCERGDEYIAGQSAHIYRYEGGGGAVLGGIQPQPLENSLDGSLDLEHVARLIKPLDFHFARTKLLCLENTMQGKVLPLPYLQSLAPFAKKHDLQLHLDGARIFNAAAACGASLAELTHMFDSVSICLSKGLGAPAGSVLAGDSSLIDRARRWRKLLGGGMRQSGVLAAAGLYAVRHNIHRLAEDHDRAFRLADGLRALGFRVEPVQTNMVYVDCSAVDLSQLKTRLLERGVIISPASRLRLATHLGIDDGAVERALLAFQRSI
jgi:threonine aldolase